MATFIGWFDGLAGAIESAPRRALAAVLALHVGLWTLVPALVQPNLPLDVIEQLAWGREWQWTYFKHPPLPAWIDEIFATLAQGNDRVLFLIGPLASGIALLLIWRLAADIVGERIALRCVLIEEAVLYFTFFTPEFNHNVVQLPLWALIGLSAHRALVGGRSADWLATGIAAAFGMLGKYSTAFLLVTLALFILLDPAARRRLRTPGPWIALAAMLLVLAPHLVALQAAHFGPLRFPFERAAVPHHWYDHIVNPLHFAGAQLADIFPALLLAALLGLRAGPGLARQEAVPPFDRRYVAALCLGPLAIILTLSAVLGMMFKDMWGTPFWDFLALFLVVFRPSTSQRLPGRFVAAAAGIFVLALLAYGLQFPLQTLMRYKPLAGQFPGRQLAQGVEAGWRTEVGDTALPYVVGDVWHAGNIAFYLWRERPSVMIDGDAAKSPWVDPIDLACRGAVLVWSGTDNGLLARFPAAVVEPDIDLSFRTLNGKPQARIGWALLPPRRGDACPAAPGAGTNH